MWINVDAPARQAGGETGEACPASVGLSLRPDEEGTTALKSSASTSISETFILRKFEY